MIILGIDPGNSGALAAITEGGGLVALYDAPVWSVVKNKKNRVEMNVAMMASLVRELKDKTDNLVAAIEQVHAMPDAGATSMFTFGTGYGMWLGVLAALRVPYDRVEPARWKKVMMDGMKKEKDASRARAKQIFPTADVSLVKHHGRADALLIAEYRRRLEGASPVANALAVLEGETT